MMTFYLNEKGISWQLGVSEATSVFTRAFEPEPLLNALKTIDIKQKWFQKEAYVAISHPQLMYKIITLDKTLSEWKCYQHIRKHFREYFHQEVTEFSVDFEWIDVEERQLRIVALPVEMVAMICTVFSSLELKVKTIDAAPFLLERLLPKNKNVQCMICVDAFQAYRMILKEGRVSSYEMGPLKKIDTFFKKSDVKGQSICMLGEYDHFFDKNLLPDRSLLTLNYASPFNESLRLCYAN